jgi:glycosyltransferase involved in cell wall biosynthesis
MLSLDEMRIEGLRERMTDSVMPEENRRSRSPSFSLVVPVYNEESVVAERLSVLHQFLGMENCELIVFDDCSVDGTLAGLRRVATCWRNPGMRLLHSSFRVGKGASIRSAVERASGEVVVLMDVDLSADLRSLPVLVGEARERGGLVIGERDVADRSTQGFLRVALSLAYNSLVRLLFRTGVKDHQCGFKAMRTADARRLMVKTRNDGFVFDTELIVLARTWGIPVRRVNVRWINNRQERSSVKWIKAGVTMMKDLIVMKLSGLPHTARPRYEGP